MKEFYTVVFFPGSTGSPKRIQVSKRWFQVGLYSTLTLVLGLTLSSTYLSQRYFQLVGDEAELIELRRESKIRKIQVEKFAQQVKNFESEMTRLERFEKKLRVITALEDSPQAISKNWGLGGPYGLSPQSLTTSLAYEARSLSEKLSKNLGNLTTHAKIQAISFQELDDFLIELIYLLSEFKYAFIHGWVN